MIGCLLFFGQVCIDRSSLCGAWVSVNQTRCSMWTRLVDLSWITSPALRNKKCFSCRSRVLLGASSACTRAAIWLCYRTVFTPCPAFLWKTIAANKALWMVWFGSYLSCWAVVRWRGSYLTPSKH